MNEGGMKYDSGKIGANMIFEYFADALWEVAKVADMGAKKYTRASWKTVPNGYERYSDAKARHMLMQYMTCIPDNEYDAESDLLHQAHEAWNALATLQMTLEKKAKEKKEKKESYIEYKLAPGEIISFNSEEKI
jgi:hypothetical protein